MMMRAVDALTDRLWRLVSWKIKVPDVIGERIRMFVKVTPEMTESECWREHYKAAYELLGILNEKAEALLVYSGITLAVVGVANSHPKAEAATMLFGLISERGYSIGIAIVILASTLCSLIVVGIYWQFLRYAIPEPNRFEYETEWNILLNALVLRQACYQIAWLLSIVALLMLVPFVLVFGL
jgi:hypothetical protein